MKKKLLSILLCTAMVLSLAACGGEKTPTSGEESNAPESSVEQSQEDVTAEALPEAFAHYTFDEGAGEAYTAVVQADKAADSVNDGATFDIVPTDVTFGYADGPVNQALYINGKFGLDLNLEATNTDTYTIAYWMNADRLATFGATLQYGYNIGKAADAGNNVTWVNVTQCEWGADGAKMFPMVWSRNEASDALDGTDCWPWMSAFDDSIHGKREWVHVAIVVTGEELTSAVGGTIIGAEYYINGQKVYDSHDNFTNHTYWADWTWDATIAPNTMQPGDSEFESYFGINYWDTVFKGFVDDLYVFDSAITAGQVLSLYELGNPSVESVAPATGDVVEEEPVNVLPEITVNADAIETLGATTRDGGFWVETTTGTAIADGETKTVVINNYSDGTANWNNFVLAFANKATTRDLLASPANYEGYAEYAVMRADCWAWGGQVDDGTGAGTTIADPAFAFTSAGSWGADWAVFAEMMKDADVTLTITRNGADLLVDCKFVAADGTEYTSNTTLTSRLTAEDECYFFFTCEKAYIEVLSIN